MVNRLSIGRLVKDKVGREAIGKDYVPVRKRNAAKLARTILKHQDNTTEN